MNELQLKYKTTSQTNYMDTLIEQLNVKLRQWQPDIAQQVRQSIKEIIELADCDALDISRSAKPCGYSRTVEQEVLDILDEPETR